MSTRVEWALGRPETYPPSGSRWRLSPENNRLAPPKWREIVVNQPLMDLVTSLQPDLVQGWTFASLVESHFVYADNLHQRLALVFTHPLKTAINDKCPSPDDFLKPEIIKEEDGAASWLPSSLKTEGINKVLEGTNWYCEEAFAGYNSIEWEKKQKVMLLWQQCKRITSYQSGVGIINLWLSPLERVILELDQRIGRKDVRRVSLDDGDLCFGDGGTIMMASDAQLQALRSRRDDLSSLVVSNPRELLPKL